MQRVNVRLEDDLTGGPADETVGFGIDGRAYEIDLNARHAAEFRRQVARFLEHASLVRPAHRRSSVRTLASRERSRQIRAWAEERGLDISERGRLPREVIQQYDSEHEAGQQTGRTARRTKADQSSRGRRGDRSGVLAARVQCHANPLAAWWSGHGRHWQVSANICQ
jgi:hypothetical protein